MNELYENRIKRVQQNMLAANIDALIISDPKSIWYLCGVENEPYERMYVLYLEKDFSVTSGKLFVNKLFNVAENDFEEFWYSDTDDYVKLLAQNIKSKGRIGIDKDWCARFLLPLMKMNSGAEYVLGSDCIDECRGCKDSTEIELMKEASRINDVCIEKAFEFVHEGVTEKEVAAYIEKCFVEEGADGASFETIVSFGANAADPHHSPDSTVVKKGDCILIDMGCRKDHYCSDMTRTRFYLEAPEEYLKLHEVCRRAHEAAKAIIRPGVSLCDIDNAARKVIADAGYGEFFTHRLGHFCGQTDHEKGDVSSANTNICKEGMIFSIEPGIYLSGKFGVRIEDLVVVTADGYESLNKVDRFATVIGDILTS